jgi:hypothetical protein
MTGGAYPIPNGAIPIVTFTRALAIVGTASVIALKANTRNSFFIITPKYKLQPCEETRRRGRLSVI